MPAAHGQPVRNPVQRVHRLRPNHSATATFTASVLRRLPNSASAVYTLVSLRQVIHGNRSAKGLGNHSVWRRLLETARRQGQKPHAFCFTLFTQATAQAQAALDRRPPVAPCLRC